MISLTLKDSWTGPLGVTYPKGTLFWISRMSHITVWGFKTPGGDIGETTWNDPVIPGSKEKN